MKRNLMLISEKSKHNTEVYNALRHFKMDVVHIDNIHEAKAGLKIHSPAFILLDSDINGLDSLLDDIILGHHSLHPYIMVAATYNSGTDRAIMLEHGADSCVDKPINVHEVIAVIGAVLRRCKRIPTITYKDMVIYLSRRIVTMHGATVNLTRKEYEVLCFLAIHAGTVLTKKEIYHAVWKDIYDHKSTNVSENCPTRPASQKMK